MSDDTNDDDGDDITIEQSEGGTMDSNLTSDSEGDGIKNGGVDSGYGATDDDDDESDTHDRGQ